jgi:hypothetical protein
MNEALTFIESQMYKLEGSNQFVMNVEDVHQVLEIFYTTELEKSMNDLEQEINRLQELTRSSLNLDSE